MHPTGDFDLPRWLADLDADHRILLEISAGVAPITPDDDDKLRALKQFLALPAVAAGKVLVFSEAQSTIDYLYEQLNPGGGDAAIARLSGANSTNQIQDIVKRFAPTANLLANEKMAGPPVRVLLATDIVSEGQNLQDCNRVVNYDLHWNPVRLIQRFGRVDRIGTTHEKIYLNNTWPDTDVDVGLSLTERLQHRIDAFHEFIGLDNALLSANEQLNPRAMYRIYEQRELPETDGVLDEVSVFQRGAAILQRLQAEDPALWQTITQLPDGVRSALSVGGPAPVPVPLVDYQPDLFGAKQQTPLMFLEPMLTLPAAVEGQPRAGETVVLFKHGERAATYAVNAEGTPRAVPLGQFVAALECAPDTPPLPLPADTNARVMAAYNLTRQEAASRLGKARRSGFDSRIRRYLARSLREARTTFRDDEQELQRLSILQDIFLARLPPTVLPALEEARRMDLRDLPLMRRLEGLREHYHLTVPDDEDVPAQTGTEVVRIVCSDGLLA